MEVVLQIFLLAAGATILIRGGGFHEGGLDIPEDSV